MNSPLIFLFFETASINLNNDLNEAQLNPKDVTSGPSLYSNGYIIIDNNCNVGLFAIKSHKSSMISKLQRSCVFKYNVSIFDWYLVLNLI
jgi:hypothetical protein